MAVDQDQLTEFCGTKISNAISDMDAYIQLTDGVFDRILQSTGSEMEKVQNFVFLICLQACTLCFHILGSQYPATTTKQGSV